MAGQSRKQRRANPRSKGSDVEKLNPNKLYPKQISLSGAARVELRRLSLEMHKSESRVVEMLILPEADNAK